MATTGDYTMNSGDILQLIKLLRDRGVINDEQAASKVAAEQWGKNLTDRTNASNAGSDAYMALLSNLASQLQSNPGADLDTLMNRAAQIRSAKFGSIDRAGAIASSQGYAQALKRGMGDSTLAEDQATTIARKLSDMYVAADEQAQQRAFDEMMARRQGLNQTFGVATQGWANANNQSLNNARANYDKAAEASRAASKSSGANWQDILSSGVSKGVQGVIDNSMKGETFTGLLGKLKTGLGFGNANDPTKVAGVDISSNDEDVYADNGWQYDSGSSSAQTQENSQPEDQQVSQSSNNWFTDLFA